MEPHPIPAMPCLQDAAMFMRQAMTLLDEAQTGIAACHLQHAIDFVAAQMPPQSAATITFSPILIETGSADEAGFLVRRDGCLVAVLVQLDDEDHGPLCGQLFLEAGFGAYAVTSALYFCGLEAARAWFQGRAKAAAAPSETHDG